MRELLFRRGFILPVVVTGVIPLAIAAATRAWVGVQPLSVALGLVVYSIGLWLLLDTTRLFARNDGSLAPWNPPKTMVATGLYRYVRNPMIVGIFHMVGGEAIALRSFWVAAWMLTFMVAKHVYIRFDEEPLLRKRFGPSYDAYCRAVPRWIPRLTPWEGNAPSIENPGTEKV